MSIEDKVEKAAKTLKRWIIWGSTLAIVVFFGLSSYFTTDAGYKYVVQDTLFGTMRVIQTPGIHIKVPFFTLIEPYKNAMTISYGNQDAGGSTSVTRQAPPATVQFADTYTADVPATFRFKMSSDDKLIIRTHEEFRSFENLVEALLLKNARNVMVVTATQYTGEEFFQGGLNSYKVKMEDQLMNGLYQTERRQVEVHQLGVAPVTSENARPEKLETQVQLIWKNVILRDNVSGELLRLTNPLDLYGITVTQVTVGKPNGEELLNKLLTDKKILVGARIRAVQDIETAKAESKAMQQRMEIDKVKAIQIAQKKKELGIIEKQREVEMERQQAKFEEVRKNKEKQIAVIQKEQELAVAEADRLIQKAAAQAAVFQAQAIRATGLAEADVDRAKLAAKQSAKDIYMAEIERDIAKALYASLKDFKVEMPTNVIMSGNGTAGTLPNNLDVLTAFGALRTMRTVETMNAEAASTLPSKN